MLAAEDPSFCAVPVVGTIWLALSQNEATASIGTANTATSIAAGPIVHDTANEFGSLALSVAEGHETEVRAAANLSANDPAAWMKAPYN